MKIRLGIITLAALLAAGLTARAEEKKGEAQKDTYPLKTCVVSGEELDSMGDVVKHTYTDAAGAQHEVRLCCKKCLKKFAQNPDKYLKMIDEAAKKDAKESSSKK